jgi:hypothetical protein
MKFRNFGKYAERRDGESRGGGDRGQTKSKLKRQKKSICKKGRQKELRMDKQMPIFDKVQ